MKILFIHQSFPGQFIHLAKKLIEQGNHVTALTINRSNKIIEGLKEIQYKVNRNSSEAIHPWATDFETKIIRAEACYQEGKRLKNSGYSPDVIYAHSGWGENLFIKEVWPNAKLLIYCEYYYNPKNQDIDFDTEFSQEKDIECKLMLKNINNIMQFEIADAAISPTYWQKSTYPAKYHHKISVVHDGINTNLVKPDERAYLKIIKPAENEITLTKSNEIITFVNRNLEPYRGYHSFMRMLPFLFGQNPNLYVLILGGAGYSYGAKPDPRVYGKKTWKEIYIEEVKLKIPASCLERIFFLDNLPYDKYLKVIQISTVHVYLTYPFVLSWSLLEAMSSGCAVVTNELNATREVITNGITGKFIDFFHYEKSARIILDLVKNSETRKMIGKNARNHIINNYDLENVCLPKQINLINDLLVRA